LIARIAAGEVVERPASVIKELAENSLDAGARRISISIEGAGRGLLGISDDGCGMTRADAKLALQRHATSKISSFDDLEALNTFGFRGEALPSIASISRFRLVTRSAEEDIGWEFILEGGKLLSEKPIARDVGTTIEVRDLFFNTPARFKFLKSDATERAQCLRVIEELVFASLEVTFEVRSEKTKPIVFKAGDADTLRARMMEAWGVRWGRGLLPVSSGSTHFSVRGHITDQAQHQATPRYQFLYINRRPVQNRRLARAIYDGYRGSLPSIRHPGWVLFLDVDPRTVDVNVHPSKREVKLTHESEIFRFIFSAIKQSLEQTSSAPSSIFAPHPVEREAVSSYTPKPTWETPSVRELYRPLDVTSNASAAFQTGLAFETAPLEKKRPQQLKAVAQAQNLFIIAHADSEILIVDQHAAQEKIIYEQLLKNLESKKPQVQQLLVPFTWEVSLSVQSAVMDKISVLHGLGFELEPFGKNTFVLKGYPSHLGDKFDLTTLLDGLSDALMDSADRRGGSERNPAHRLAAMSACKAAVKAGDALDLKECQSLVEEIFTCDAPFTCPHGRPTMVRLPFEDLKHKFRRI
jgi:DNA mismatch repair protein MutL